MKISYTFVYAKDHNNLNSITEALVQLHLIISKALISVLQHILQHT